MDDTEYRELQARIEADMARVTAENVKRRAKRPAKAARKKKCSCHGTYGCRLHDERA